MRAGQGVIVKWHKTNLVQNHRFHSQCANTHSLINKFGDSKAKRRGAQIKKMFGLLLVLGISIAPFTQHFPPCRQLSYLVGKIQNYLEETAMYYRRAYPLIQMACRRILIRCGLYRPHNSTSRRRTWFLCIYFLWWEMIKSCDYILQILNPVGYQMFQRVPMGYLWISVPYCGRGWTAIGNNYFAKLRYALKIPGLNGHWK